MTKILSICFLIIIFLVTGFAQKAKPWTEWAKKDAEKILNESAWAQTQDESATSDMSLKYQVRFFSAKPVREAFARMVVLQQQQAHVEEQKLKAFAGKMQGWIDVDLGDIVVLAVSVEATDRRLSGPVEQALRSATSEALKRTCYLERKDGKRVYLTVYEQPTADQTGAKFVFPRSLEGQPFLTSDGDFVRFVAEFSDKIKINRKYKISDMMYNGKLEY